MKQDLNIKILRWPRTSTAITKRNIVNKENFTNKKVLLTYKKDLLPYKQDLLTYIKNICLQIQKNPRQRATSNSCGKFSRHIATANSCSKFPRQILATNSRGKQLR